MIPSNSTLVYICSKTDPQQKTCSPRRVRISQKEDHWVVKPSNTLS